MSGEVITRKYLLQWLKDLETAWIRKDFDLVGVLFVKCAKYVEAPFIEPARNIDDIKKFWNEVKRHSDVNLSYDIIVISENKAVVNYSARYFDGTQHQHSNGIYVIEFDQLGHCTTFMQWSVMMI